MQCPKTHVIFYLYCYMYFEQNKWWRWCLCTPMASFKPAIKNVDFSLDVNCSWFSSFNAYAVCFVRAAVNLCFGLVVAHMLQCIVFLVYVLLSKQINKFPIQVPVLSQCQEQFGFDMRNVYIYKHLYKHLYMLGNFWKIQKSCLTVVEFVWGCFSVLYISSVLPRTVWWIIWINKTYINKYLNICVVQVCRRYNSSLVRQVSVRCRNGTDAGCDRGASVDVIRVRVRRMVAWRLVAMATRRLQFPISRSWSYDHQSMQNIYKLHRGIIGYSDTDRRGAPRTIYWPRARKLVTNS